MDLETLKLLSEPDGYARVRLGLNLYPGKHSGVIVDYANVFASLEKALAI